MRVINIVVTDTRSHIPLIESMKSFGIYEEQLSNDVVEAAEEEFRETVVRLSGFESNTVQADDLRDHANDSIDDGWVQISDRIVSMVWSEI